MSCTPFRQQVALQSISLRNLRTPWVLGPRMTKLDVWWNRMKIPSVGNPRCSTAQSIRLVRSGVFCRGDHVEWCTGLWQGEDWVVQT